MAQPDYFDSLTSGFAPLAAGRSYQELTGLEGLPFSDNLLAQLVGGPMVQKLMGQYGMMPMGLGHDRNVADTLRKFEFQKHYQEVLAAQHGHESDSLMEGFRGLAHVTGTPYGARQRRAARTLSDGVSNMAPMLAMMAPDLLDQMGGMQGSATVMASQIAMGGRYRMDAATGRMGLSTETAAQQSKDLFRELYVDGDMEDVAGLSAGQMGSVYDELTRRGMIESVEGTSRERTRRAVRSLDREELQGAAERQGVKLPTDSALITPDDLDKLMLDDSVATRLRSFDTQGVKRSLKEYAGVIAAMRDIFGDRGRPNAPIPELIKGLEAMTQGSVGTIDSGRLNMMVRTTHELARQSGMSLDSASMMQQHAASQTERFGLDRSHAINATQGAMAWGSAFRAQGGSATPSWGRYGADEMTQLDSNLRVQAAASEQSNRLGLLMRVRDRIGGFESGSTAEALAEAVESGATEFYDPVSGRVKSTLMQSGEIPELLSKAKGRGGQDLGLTDGAVTSMMQERRTNEQFVERYDIANTTRKHMATEMTGYVSDRFAESLTNRLKSAGMSDEDARKAAYRAADGVASRTMELSHSEFSDDSTRTDRMGRIIREELAATEAGQFLDDAGMGEDFYELSAEQSYGYVNRRLRSDPKTRAFGHFQNLHAISNEDTTRVAQQNRDAATFKAQLASDLAPLGRGSGLRRAVSYLKDADDDASVGELISTALGGVDVAKIDDEFQGATRDLAKQQKKVEDLQEKVAAAPDETSREKLMESLREERKTLQDQVDSLSSRAEEMGLSSKEGRLNLEDVQQARRHFDTAEMAVQDLHGLRGMFSNEVSDEEKEKAEGSKFENAAIARDALERRMMDSVEENLDDDDVEAYFKANLGSFIDEDAAREDLIARRQDAAIRSIDEGSVQSFMDRETVQADEAERVALMRRQQISTTPTEDEIDQFIKEDPLLTRDEAYKQAAAVRRGQRLGLAPEEIEEQLEALESAHDDEGLWNAVPDFVQSKRQRFKNHMADYNEQLQELADEHTGGDKQALLTRRAEFGESVAEEVTEIAEGMNDTHSKLQTMTMDRAIELAFQERYKTTEGGLLSDPTGMFAVTDDDIAELRESDETYGASGTLGLGYAVSDEDAKKEVLRRRQEKFRGDWATFWGTESGETTREAIDDMMGSADDVSTMALMSEADLERLGPQAIYHHKQIQEAQDRSYSMAREYAGGDIARLFSGDLEIDTTTKEGQEKFQEVRQEANALREQMRESVGFYEDSVGKVGYTAWGEDDELTARTLLGFDPEQELDDDQQEELDETIEKVASAKKMLTEDVDAVRGVDRAREKFADVADRYGVTAEEAEGFLGEADWFWQNGKPSGEAGARLTALTDEEKTQIEEAELKMSAAQTNGIDANMPNPSEVARFREAAGLDSSIERDDAMKITELLQGSDADTDETRAAVEQLAGYEPGQMSDDQFEDLKGASADLEPKSEAYQQAKADIAAAKESVAPIAEARGMTVDELMTGYEAGTLFDGGEDIEELRAAYEAKQKAEDKLKMSVDKTEMSEEELRGGVEAIDQVGELGEEAALIEDTSTQSMVEELFESVGLDSDKYEDEIRSGAMDVESEAGRSFTRRLVATNDTLQDAVESRRSNLEKSAKEAWTAGGADEYRRKAAALASSEDDPYRGISRMLYDYEQINSIEDDDEREEKLEAFRTESGMTELGFEQFQSAAEIHRQTGMSQVGSPEDDAERAERMGKMLEMLGRTEEYGQSVQQEEKQQTIRLEGTLDVNLQDRKADIAATGNRRK